MDTLPNEILWIIILFSINYHSHRLIASSIFQIGQINNSFREVVYDQNIIRLCIPEKCFSRWLRQLSSPYLLMMNRYYARRELTITKFNPNPKATPNTFSSYAYQYDRVRDVKERISWRINIAPHNFKLIIHSKELILTNPKNHMSDFIPEWPTDIEIIIKTQMGYFNYENISHYTYV